MDGKTQAAAAAASGMSLRTAREWDTGPAPSATKQRRDWRTVRIPLGRSGSVTSSPSCSAIRRACAADPAHKIVNPVLYRLDEALACWRNISAPVLWLWGDGAWVKKWLKENEADLDSIGARHSATSPSKRCRMPDTCCITISLNSWLACWRSSLLTKTVEPQRRRGTRRKPNPED